MPIRPPSRVPVGTISLSLPHFRNTRWSPKARETTNILLFVPPCDFHLRPQSLQRNREAPLQTTRKKSLFHLPMPLESPVPRPQTHLASRDPPVAPVPAAETSLPEMLPPAHTPASTPRAGTHIWQTVPQNGLASPDLPAPLRLALPSTNSSPRLPSPYLK